VDAEEDPDVAQYEQEEERAVAEQQKRSGPLPKMQRDLSHDDVFNMLHPMEPKAKKEMTVIKHVADHMPSNLALLGVPANFDDKPKIVKPKMDSIKRAAVTFVPGFVKDNLLTVDDAWSNKGKQKAKPKKKEKVHLKPPGALDSLLEHTAKVERAKKKKQDDIEQAKKQQRHAHNKFDDLDDVVETLKRKIVNKGKAKAAKAKAKVDAAALKLDILRGKLDKLEKGKKDILSDEKTEANKQAAAWLLKLQKGKDFNFKVLNELIHWHTVADHGGVGKDEITAMVERANKKKLSQTTVVAQVTSANAKAAAFHALKENTTPQTPQKKRFQVANQAVQDVVAASKVLDKHHQENVASVAKHKVKTLLSLQLSLEKEADSTIGHAAVTAGGFCVLDWWKAAVNVGCEAHV